MSNRVAQVITIVRNCRLWGGRAPQKKSPSSQSTSTSTSTWILMFTNRGISGEDLIKIINKMFLPPQSRPLWATLITWLPWTDTVLLSSWQPMSCTTKESRIWQDFESRWKSPNQCTLTIKVNVSFSSLSIHGHWTKDDLDWTPLSRVTASQSLDFLYFGCFSVQKDMETNRLWRQTGCCRY